MKIYSYIFRAPAARDSCLVIILAKCALENKLLSTSIILVYHIFL